MIKYFNQNQSHYSGKSIWRAAMLLSFIGLGFAAQAYRINAAVDTPDGTKFYLSYRLNDKIIVDSTVAKANKFVFTGSYPEAVICTLSNSVNHQIRLFFGENLTISINGTIENFNNAKLMGGPENKIWMAYKDASYEVADKFRQTVKATGSDLHDKTTKAYTMMRYSKDSLLSVFVKANQGSNAAAWAILDTYVTNPDREQAEKFYLMLSPEARQSSYGKKIASFYTAGKTIAAGQPAPNFTLKDMNGKPIHLIDYRGNYVFVDFWASWCGPCRKENPGIVKCFNDYASAKLQFLSVSMDASAESWRKAVRTDKLSWPQVNDPESTQGYVADLYGIKSLPFNLVIDPDGKIVAINLRGKGLKAFLTQRFNSNKH